MIRSCAIALFSCVLVVSANTLSADVRADEKTQFQLAGVLGKVVNIFGGKAAREGVTSVVAVKGDRIVVTGEVSSSIVYRILARGFDLQTGQMDWEVLSPYMNIEFARDIVLNDHALYIVGSRGDGAGNHFMVRALDAANGALLWEDFSHLGFALGSTAVAAALGKNRLFVAGTADNQFVIRAYDIR